MSLPSGITVLAPTITISSTVEASEVNPNPPTIVSVGQALGFVVVGVLPASTSGLFEPYEYNLYRTAPGGARTLIYTTLLSITSVENLLFDRDATVGVQYTYDATCVDVNGNESVASESAQFIPFGPDGYGTLTQQTNITQAAFGPYPLLGSDIYLDASTRDAVVGPNGDYLQVSGLQCLAQDIRINILIEIGELALQPKLGFDRTNVIGSGNASAPAQAQILSSRIRTLLNQQARVLEVVDVQISTSTGGDGWIITYIIMAAGVEDSQKLIATIPFGF